MQGHCLYCFRNSPLASNYIVWVCKEIYQTWKFYWCKILPVMMVLLMLCQWLWFYWQKILQLITLHYMETCIGNIIDKLNILHFFLVLQLHANKEVGESWWKVKVKADKSPLLWSVWPKSNNNIWFLQFNLVLIYPHQVKANKSPLLWSVWPK